MPEQKESKKETEREKKARRVERFPWAIALPNARETSS